MDDGRLPKQVGHWEMDTIVQRPGEPGTNSIDSIDKIGSRGGALERCVLTEETGVDVWPSVSLIRDEANDSRNVFD